MAVASLFERLGQKPLADESKQLEPEIVRRGPQPLIPPVPPRSSSPSEKLLSWLVNYWAGQTVNLRDIRAYGPNCARNASDTISLTKTLAEYGWLVPTSVHRRDMKRWRIVREPPTQG